MSGSGLLVVDKPGGLTSHDVVARVRRVMGTRKVGHAGTLDPMATGVLVIGVNKATRLLGHLALHDKRYLATMRLGSSTVTDDREGEAISVADPAQVASVTDDAIRSAAASLVGEIDQQPSAVSAIKVDGRRAYDRVRAGGRMPASRRVVVLRLDVVSIVRAEPWIDVDLDVECSTGTYVRALARDMGAASAWAATSRRCAAPAGLFSDPSASATPRTVEPMPCAYARRRDCVLRSGPRRGAGACRGSAAHRLGRPHPAGDLSPSSIPGSSWPWLSATARPLSAVLG